MSRKKDALNEEMMRLQQRLEQAGETIGRLNRTIDDHVKHGEEKQEKQHLQEQLASVRSEKDALEAVLFDTANMLEDAESKRAKLEHDLQDTEKKLRETKSSMQQQSGKKEAEYQQIITNLNRTTADNITKLKEEKEQLRQSLEQKLSQTIAVLTSEKEVLEACAREKEKKLLIARDQLIMQHDEAMLRAENDKQQALLMAHQEHQALIERLEEAKRILNCEQSKLERVKRDAHARADQDRTYINQLKDDISKEALNRECQETRAQLSLAEDKHDAAYAQLHDTIRRLKELENESESLRKELTDTRRQLSNCTAERDKYNSACKELREHVKRAEHERREAARDRDEAYHKIAGLEESRTTLDVELSRVQQLLKDAETGGQQADRQLRSTEAQLKRERAALEQANHDIKELQLQNESEERERITSEAGTLKRHCGERW
ncbi:unnamed protein product, partial [Leptidea sinapis]